MEVLEKPVLSGETGSETSSPEAFDVIRTRRGVKSPQLGRLLFQYRLDHDLTQVGLARKIQINPLKISMVERGLSVSFRSFALLADFIRSGGRERTLKAGVGVASLETGDI